MFDRGVGPDYHQIGPAGVFCGKLAGPAGFGSVDEPELYTATTSVGSYLVVAGLRAAHDNDPADLPLFKDQRCCL